MQRTHTSIFPSAADKTAPRVALCRQLEENWNRIQVGRQGSYSIERLVSLDQYCNTTSWTRVILVCVSTPIPSLLVAVLLECFPLRPPSEGWVANWVFWLRMSLTSVLLAFGGYSQLAAFVPDLHFTLCKQIIASTGLAVGLIGTSILAAKIIGFPVPLLMQFGAIPTGFFAVLLLRLVGGSDAFASGSPIVAQMKRFQRYFLALIILTGFYPLFKVLYDSVPLAYRGGVILVLPVWRFAAKHFIVYVSRDLEDIIPESVAFLVDFFSSLFVSVCMSSSGPFYLSFLFIAADLSQILLELRELSGNAKVVLQLIGPQLQDPIHPRSSTPEPTTLLTRILGATKEPRAFRAESMGPVRVWACLPHSLTSKQVEQLAHLEESGVYYQRNPSSNNHMKQSLLQTQNGFKQRTSIVPTSTLKHEIASPTTQDPINAKNKQSTRPNGSGSGLKKSKLLVLQGLQLLFHCEYLQLVEYVECITPIVYVVYKSILEQLPNIVYYPGGAGNWSLATVVNILVLAMMEVGSLVFLHHFLQRKFAISAMHQLAFVLETHAYLIQVKLLIGILVLIPFELEHLGADFSLRFEWLDSK
ncbi:hypothetical protein F443_07274 [Phytophthora nicotianae P1569]|uniref:Uncharacterized protein n=1 Tax=Phytophthora nicotianae P1569 TaxID=1317065 RepID=V9FB99_PHYNI|nr:hypothetical protein F443_07274 [Phytophthora nicotianae P1569]